jgi:hypothetical protein
MTYRKLERRPNDTLHSKDRSSAQRRAVSAFNGNKASPSTPAAYVSLRLGSSASIDTALSDHLLRLQRQHGNRYVARVLNRLRSARRESEVTPGLEYTIQRARGCGQPLDPPVRTQMETSFGADFGHVRIHTGADADVLSRDLNANAFTIGRDVFFRHGEYNPGSSSGKELLAHELTHVVQQSASGAVRSGRLRVGQSDDAHEKEADRVATEVINGNERRVDIKDFPATLKTHPDSLSGSSLIQRRQRRVFFAQGRPQEAESTAGRQLPQYLDLAQTSIRHLQSTRGISQGRHVTLTGRASREAPASLSDPQKMEFNQQLSERRNTVVANYLQHSENPPWIMAWNPLGDRGADDDPLWRRVEVDIQEEQGEPPVPEEEEAAEESEGISAIDVVSPPTEQIAIVERTDWGYGQPPGFEDNSFVRFRVTRSIRRVANDRANATFEVEVMDHRDEIDNDDHTSVFRGNVGLRVENGTLVMDERMAIERQNVSIAGDLEIRAGYESIGTNRWELRFEVTYINKKQQPDGGGGLSVSVLGSGGGLTAPSGVRGGGSVARMFVGGTIGTNRGR